MGPKKNVSEVAKKNISEVAQKKIKLVRLQKNTSALPKKNVSVAFEIRRSLSGATEQIVFSKQGNGPGQRALIIDHG